MSPINKYLAKLFFKTVVYSTTMRIIIELLRDGRENLDLVGAIMFGFLFGLNVSFMVPNVCPHLFFNPSFTYFNSGKNPEIIAKLREAKVPIKEEITLFNPNGEVDNVILQDPGGFGFFVFND